jgi:hypothetical protein
VTDPTIATQKITCSKTFIAPDHKEFAHTAHRGQHHSQVYATSFFGGLTSFALRPDADPETMARMMKWPRSKIVQAAIASAIALLSGLYTFATIAMASFNNFYFPPHKAYPYPYPTVWAARIAMGEKCGLTFLGVFAILYAAQRLLTSPRHKNSDSPATTPTS